MSFARYYNKAQQAHLDMKDSMLAYEFVPDQMSELTPGPRYVKNALNRD